MQFDKRVKIAAAAAGIGIVGSGAALKSVESVDEGKVGLVTTFGKVSRQIEPGLNFHYPWQSAIIMDVRSQTVDIPLEVYSKDSQLAPQCVLSVTFSLPKESAQRVYSKYGEKYFEAVLKNQIENIFREAFGHRTADQIISDRETLNKDVSNRLELEFKSRDIQFERLSISIKFNDSYNHSAEESAIARTRVNTETQNMERKRIEADQKVMEAKAEADALLAKKKAEAEGIEAVGKAEAGVVKLKAEALSTNPDYPKLIAAEAWNGTLPTTMVPGSALPFIELPAIDRTKAVSELPK